MTLLIAQRLDDSIVITADTKREFFGGRWNCTLGFFE